MKPDYYILKDKGIIESVLLMRCVDDVWMINSTSNNSTPPTYGHNRGANNGWMETELHKTKPYWWRHISNIIAETMWPNLTK